MRKDPLRGAGTPVIKATDDSPESPERAGLIVEEQAAPCRRYPNRILQFTDSPYGDPSVQDFGFRLILVNDFSQPRR